MTLLKTLARKLRRDNAKTFARACHIEGRSFDGVFAMHCTMFEGERGKPLEKVAHFIAADYDTADVLSWRFEAHGVQGAREWARGRRDVREYALPKARPAVRALEGFERAIVNSAFIGAAIFFASVIWRFL